MTDITDLIARLRSWDHCWPAKWLEPAVQQAADQLEALHQQLADAQAAQALVVERAAEAAENVDYPWTQGDHLNQMDASDTTARAIAEAIRALADPSGVEALAALRDDAEKWRSIASDNGRAAMDNLAAIVALEGERDAALARLAETEGKLRVERDALKVRYDDLYADALADAKSDAQDFEGELWKAIRSILDDFDYDWSGDALEDGVTANEAAEFIRDTLDGETMRADTAIAERDALAAKLAAAEARVEALTEALDGAALAMKSARGVIVSKHEHALLTGALVKCAEAKAGVSIPAALTPPRRGDEGMTEAPTPKPLDDPQIKRVYEIMNRDKSKAYADTTCALIVQAFRACLEAGVTVEGEK